jgi:hypothetical protein
MTVPTCLNFCSSKGYKYAGLEYVSDESSPYCSTAQDRY